MKVSRISLAVKSAFVLSLPLLLLGCQGGSNSSATPTPPAGNVRDGEFNNIPIEAFAVLPYHK